jgi:hypothetical protein
MNEGRFRSASDASADAGQAALNSFAPADINKLLKRVLESSCFRGSLRLTNFLKFVVETTLAGKAANIKAYTIAVEALDRGCDFDPQSDPIVRVEAGRLRQALARYYGEAGRDDRSSLKCRAAPMCRSFAAASPRRRQRMIRSRLPVLSFWPQAGGNLNCCTKQ